MNKMNQVQLADNVNLYVLPCDIFKTVSIRVFFPCELDDNYTYQALIPQILKRGTVSYPDQKSIDIFLQELYDADVSANVRKYGNKQVLSFCMSVVNDRFIVPKEDLFSSAVDFLYELIYKPVKENGLFRQDYVLQEAFNLKQQILSTVNDKPSYSVKRLNEEMNPGKAFTKCVYGDVSDLESIDEKRLFDVYTNIITNTPVNIFVAGDVDVNKVKEVFEARFRFNGKSSLPLYIPEAVVPGEIKYVTEEMNINQGRLNIGYRTNITLADKEYFNLVMFNAVFGGAVTSKLFRNVREKASLCYSIGSFVDKFNGQLIVYTGIDCKNYEKALTLIREQKQAIENGDISDFEFDTALKDILSELKGLNDSAASMIDINFRGILAGRLFSVDEYREALNKVTKDDIRRIASMIKEDTVYFLKSR